MSDKQAGNSWRTSWRGEACSFSKPGLTLAEKFPTISQIDVTVSESDL